MRQVGIASASRGYVLGRYRVTPPWVLGEVAVAVADVAVTRSHVPLTARVRGFVRGRRLSARTTPAVSALRWRTALRLRLRAAR